MFYIIYCFVLLLCCYVLLLYCYVLFYIKYNIKEAFVYNKKDNDASKETFPRNEEKRQYKL